MWITTSPKWTKITVVIKIYLWFYRSMSIKENKCLVVLIPSLNNITKESRFLTRFMIWIAMVIKSLNSLLIKNSWRTHLGKRRNWEGKRKWNRGLLILLSTVLSLLKTQSRIWREEGLLTFLVRKLLKLPCLKQGKSSKTLTVKYKKWSKMRVLEWRKMNNKYEYQLCI